MQNKLERNLNVRIFLRVQKFPEILRNFFNTSNLSRTINFILLLNLLMATNHHVELEFFTAILINPTLTVQQCILLYFWHSEK
jgi:hypothetical protein